MHVVLVILALANGFFFALPVFFAVLLLLAAIVLPVRFGIPLLWLTVAALEDATALTLGVAFGTRSTYFPPVKRSSCCC